MRRLKRIALVAVGMVSLALGIAGAFLPVLPTTPFLLLAAAAFARSSERLHAWILGNPWFGPPIRAYVERRGIHLRVKVAVIAALWLSIGASIMFLVRGTAVRIALATVAAGVTWHIASFRTLHGPATAGPDPSAPRRDPRT